jgi:hypothetical protein
MHSAFSADEDVESSTSFRNRDPQHCSQENADDAAASGSGVIRLWRGAFQ